MQRHQIIVDENDSPIGSRHWRDMQYEDIYRVSALWLTDRKSGDILLAQRRWDKQNDPGKWASAVAGTVEVGETYKGNIVKETAEEIGLSNLDFRRGPKTFTDDGKHKFFCQWFLADVDKDKTKIEFQKEEVEAIAWMPKKDLIEEVKKIPQKYVPSMPANLKALSIT